MSNKKQTAVEWHHEKVSNLIEMLKRKYVNQEEFLGGLINLRDQAKEMEREQIQDAFMEGDSFEGRASKKDFEHYYTETYNTNEP
jgi:CRISPR/Cas system-associated endonuclease Cas1